MIANITQKAEQIKLQRESKQTPPAVSETQQAEQTKPQREGKQTPPAVREKHKKSSKPKDRPSQRKQSDNAKQKRTKDKHKERHQQDNTTLQVLSVFRAQQARASDLTALLQKVSTAQTGREASTALCNLCYQIVTLAMVLEPREQTGEAFLECIKKVNDRTILESLMLAKCVKDNPTLEGQPIHVVVHRVWTATINR